MMGHLGHNNGRGNVFPSLCRAIGLGVLGYAVFAAIVGLHLGFLQYRSSSAFPVIDWSSGLLCAIAFASSEVLNTSRRGTTGILRRVIVAAGLMVGTILVAIAASNAFGWHESRSDPDRWYWHKMVLLISIYASAVLVVRHVWGERFSRETGLRDE
jgi:hypothetical protein